jgi:hypothetical protein
LGNNANFRQPSQLGNNANFRQPSQLGNNANFRQPSQLGNNANFRQPSQLGNNANFRQPSQLGNNANFRQPSQLGNNAKIGRDVPAERLYGVTRFTDGQWGYAFYRWSMGIPVPPTIAPRRSLQFGRPLLRQNQTARLRCPRLEQIGQTDALECFHPRWQHAA